MSEEKAPAAEETPHETPDAVEAAAPAATVAASKPTIPTMMALAVLIVVLLVVLIIITWGGSRSGKATPAELTELQAEANALRNQLNRERVALGLRPLEGNAESMDDIAARMKKDADTMVALAGSFQNMLMEKDAEISAKNAELIRSEQLRQTLASESARLQGELQRALVGSSEVEMLRREQAAMKSQRDALSAEVASMRQELAQKAGGVSAEELADVKRQLEETQRARDFFEARAAELEGELSKATLFAENENELLPAAVELFRRLRKLEGKSDAEISSAYSSLGVELGANVLHTLNFATGSSDLSPADQDVLRRLAGEIPDGDLLLIVGYASETGNVDKNRTLSSDRATHAAEFYTGLKRPAQLVQGVYLGQTDRFSSRTPERNQIVEIWQIRKK